MKEETWLGWEGGGPKNPSRGPLSPSAWPPKPGPGVCVLGESGTPKHPPAGSVAASTSRLEGAPWSKCELDYFWRGVRFWGRGETSGSAEVGGRCRSPMPRSTSASLIPKSRAGFATGGVVTALPSVGTLGNTTGFGWFYKTLSSRRQAITPGFAFLLNGGL